jgi:hypothetical protein
MAFWIALLWIGCASALAVWFFRAHTVMLQPATPPPQVHAAAPVVVGPPLKPPYLIAPAPRVDRAIKLAPAPPPIAIQPPKLEPWEEKGWKRRMESTTVIYEGFFIVTEKRTGQKRRFRGKVKMEAGVARPYVADPPKEFFAHPKSACLREWKEKPWFWLNWARPTTKVDEAIFYMERILAEAINSR